MVFLIGISVLNCSFKYAVPGISKTSFWKVFFGCFLEFLTAGYSRSHSFRMNALTIIFESIPAFCTFECIFGGLRSQVNQ